MHLACCKPVHGDLTVDSLVVFACMQPAATADQLLHVMQASLIVTRAARKGG